MNTKKMLWLVPFLSFFSSYLLMSFLYRIDEQQVPSLVGTSLQEAVTLLSHCHLNLTIIDEKEEPDLPAGTILSQTPSAGKKIKINKSIYAIIAKQPARPCAPALIGKKKEQVTKELASLNVRQRSYYLPSDAPRDSCIAQYPQEQEPIIEKSITVYFSSGNNKPVVMPDCISHPLATVQELLEQHGITTEIVSAYHKPRALHDAVVIDQRPLPGSLLELNPTKPLTVQLYVR